MVKVIVIKTSEAIIYVANGKVTLVKNAINGRFMKIAKFATIVNNLMTLTKRAYNAIESNVGFYYSVTTKLALNTYKNAVRMFNALFGDVTIIYKRNHHATGFDLNTLALYI